MFDEREDIVEKLSLIKYHCSNCNASFFTSGKNTFNNCILCKSSELEKDEFSVNKSIKIIPFKKEYKDAVADYNKKVKFNPLVPIEFKKKKNFATLQKIYVPTLITNISMKGDIEFVGAEKGNTYKDTVLENKKYDIVQKVDFNYTDVLLKISSKVDDDVFNIISNYDYFNTVDIDSDYFDDSYYLNEDISLNDISSNGKDNVLGHAMKLIRNNVKHSMKKVKKDSTIVKFENTRELLVPVYVLKVKYKNKDYTYIMNGESGKSYIDLPISTMNIIIVSIISFILIFLIAFLISYFF